MTFIDSLRAELVDLLAEVSAHALPAHPTRFEDHPDGALRIWHGNEVMWVHTMRGDDGKGAVFVTAGPAMEYTHSGGRDWLSLRPLEAITLGNALLAAAADCERDI